ncbi:MAG TPA: peptidase M61, partial [Microscillaceae bacterium]|nr:peptidase M61 [Microscillaceae bacterium]
MPAPHTHYFEVEMQIDDLSDAYVDLKMAVWTPGSYLVREYARHVEGFRAVDANNQPVSANKINKNTWRVQTNGAKKVVVKYSVYAFELTVRTSFLNAAHGYVNPASVFMFVDKQTNTPAELVIQPFGDWDRVSTGLPAVPGKPFTYNIPNLDIFIDSPIEIGKHKEFSFDAAGVKHRVAIFGVDDFDQAKIEREFKAVIEASTAIFGENPCANYLDKDYTFIVHLTASGGGGLEHLNSTSLQYSRNLYQVGTDFLGLVAHEYFHLWNVKRLRPAPLGPFDYENENYTPLLWQAEGFTVYYEDVILLRAGFISPTEF